MQDLNRINRLEISIEKNIEILEQRESQAKICTDNEAGAKLKKEIQRVNTRLKRLKYEYTHLTGKAWTSQHGIIQVINPSEFVKKEPEVDVFKEAMKLLKGLKFKRRTRIVDVEIKGQKKTKYLPLERSHSVWRRAKIILNNHTAKVDVRLFKDKNYEQFKSQRNIKILLKP